MPEVLDPPAPAIAPLKLPDIPSAPKTPPAPQNAPKAPETPPAGTEPKAPPANLLADAPPGEQKSAAGIPTDIHDGTTPAKKTDAQFAEERRKAKEEEQRKKFGVDDIQKQRDEALQQQANATLELENLRREREELVRQNEEYKGIAETRKTEVEQVTGKYFDQFKAEVNPAEDPEFAGAYNQFHTAMVATLPETLPTAAGEKPFIPEAFLANPQNSAQVGNIMAHYAAARNTGNTANMQMAVTAMAQLMGANFIASTDPEVAQLVEPSSELYRQISTAMKTGLPHFQQMDSRGRLLREEAPRLVQEKLVGREQNIRASLEKGIYMPIEQASERLAQNPSDSAALISALINENEPLKQLADQAIAGMAPAFARMGQLQMPTLASNRPEDIQAHQRDVQRFQGILGGAMKDAVLGRVSGPIIADLYSKLQAAEARANAAANNTNPGRMADLSNGAPQNTKGPSTEI